VGEFVHPVPLVALALLALNDHVLKGWDVLPPWLAGKLSDFAGVVFFPLLLTALANTLAACFNRFAEVAGLPMRFDDQLRRWKLIVACAATAVILASIQLIAPAVEIYTGLVGALGFPSVVAMDPTDILALVLLPVPYIVGMRRIGAHRSSDRS